MATRAEILTILKPLNRHFKRFLMAMDKDERQEFLEDYGRELQDLPVEALMFAVKAILNATREWYSFPSIGDIRGHANVCIAPQYPTPEEAWKSVMAEPETLTESPHPLAVWVFRNLQLSRWDPKFTSEHGMVEKQKSFLWAYKDAVKREQEIDALPKELQKIRRPRSIAQRLALAEPKPVTRQAIEDQSTEPVERDLTGIRQLSAQVSDLGLPSKAKPWQPDRPSHILPTLQQITQRDTFENSQAEKPQADVIDFAAKQEEHEQRVRAQAAAMKAQAKNDEEESA